MLGRLVERAAEQHRLGELDARPDMRGLDLDHALQVADGAAQVPLGLERLGDAVERGHVQLVGAQRVAEFQDRLFRLALLGELDAALIVLGGALLGAVAGGRQQQGREQQDGVEKAAASDHRHIPSRRQSMAPPGARGPPSRERGPAHGADQ